MKPPYIIEEAVKFFESFLDTTMKRGAAVQLSVLHKFIQLSLNSGSAQAQILLAVSRRFVMVRISDNGPDWKWD